MHTLCVRQTEPLFISLADGDSTECLTSHHLLIDRPVCVCVCVFQSYRSTRSNSWNQLFTRPDSLSRFSFLLTSTSISRGQFVTCPTTVASATLLWTHSNAAQVCVCGDFQFPQWVLFLIGDLISANHVTAFVMTFVSRHRWSRPVSHYPHQCVLWAGVPGVGEGRRAAHHLSRTTQAASCAASAN